MNDLISRQAAIDAIERNACNTQRAIDAVIGLPSAQPEKRTEERTETHGVCLDTISRQDAIDALDVLCQEHRYKIPGKVETYSQYNEAWQDALDRAEGAIGNLPSAQPVTPCYLGSPCEYQNPDAKMPSAQPEVIRCKDCKNWDTTWQNDWAKNYHYCPLIDGTRNGDWYCADAERRTDE